MTHFTPALLSWHDHHNKRQLPWKGIRDPYKIWLSEIILQQTRAEQGRPYYERFIAAYPTVGDLARATDDAVFRLWQGLGYYSRCRNLLATARTVNTEYGGHFPDTYESLLRLKGIGPYTAAAIASFAFDRPHAVVDGNVFRVLARYLGIHTPPASPEGKALFTEKANALLDSNRPAAWNQAIMDLGATVCLPVAPRCEVCPLQHHCYAFKKGVTADLPVRVAKAPLRQRHLHYLFLEAEGKIWFSRTTTGIWQGLYQPFLVETAAPLDRKALAAHPAVAVLGIAPDAVQYEGYLQRKLTHQALGIYFFRAVLPEPLSATLLPGGDWVPVAALPDLPLPKPMALFFEKKSYF